MYSMGRMTLITGDERRSRWSDDDRARIFVAQTPGAVVAEVARRKDVCTSLVYKWRREARKSACASAPGFTPVVIETSSASLVSPPIAGASDVIVVEVNDARVRIGTGAPAALIAATLKALRP